MIYWKHQQPTYHVFRLCCHWAGQQCRQRLSVDLFPCTHPFLGVTSLPLLYSDAHLSRDFWICRQASFVFVWSIDLPVLVCVSADRQRLMGCPMTRHDFTQKCTHKKSFGAHLRQWDAKSEARPDSTKNWYVPEIVRSATIIYQWNIPSSPVKPYYLFQNGREYCHTVVSQRSGLCAPTTFCLVWPWPRKSIHLPLHMRFEATAPRQDKCQLNITLAVVHVRRKNAKPCLTRAIHSAVSSVKF